MAELTTATENAAGWKVSGHRTCTMAHTCTHVHFGAEWWFFCGKHCACKGQLRWGCMMWLEQGKMETMRMTA